MGSPQTLSEDDRRIAALWAADYADRAVTMFEAEAPTDGRPADAIARVHAFGRDELGHPRTDPQPVRRRRRRYTRETDQRGVEMGSKEEDQKMCAGCVVPAPW